MSASGVRRREPTPHDAVLRQEHVVFSATWLLISGVVSLQLEDADGEGVRIRVSDTGPGIAEELLPHVFERFRQADGSVRRQHGGLGLGLAIVRHLTELHGGTGQVEPFNAMRAGIAEAALVTPPLDARGRRDGFNLVYRLNDLGLPAVYSSLHANGKTLRERSSIAQRWVAALAESVQFVEKNPDKGKAAVSKALKLNDADALQSAYDAYAKLLINRRLIVPEHTVAGVIDVAREQGTNIRRKAAEIVDNRFAEDLEKSGFLKELWGADLAR